MKNIHLGFILIALGLSCMVASISMLIYDRLYTEYPQTLDIGTSFKTSCNCYQEEIECKLKTNESSFMEPEAQQEQETQQQFAEQGIQTTPNPNISSMQTQTEEMKVDELFVFAMKKQSLLSVNEWAKKFKCLKTDGNPSQYVFYFLFFCMSG